MFTLFDVNRVCFVLQSDLDLEGLPAHSRSVSAISLNENSYHNRASNGGHHVISHGKPSLAPKPPGFKSNEKNDGRHSVTRAQSMRLPRSAISASEIKNGK